MQTFKVYQLKGDTNRQTRWELSTPFGGDDVEEKARSAFCLGSYTHVANIQAPNLELVFQVGNIGPEELIERIGQMASVSMGDIVVTEDEKAYLCAACGWTYLHDLVSEAFEYDFSHLDNMEVA
tara:strand:- start:1275 stop:1646 length:372 start_codon:yes stop_codon:yes gene_type:complete